MREVKKAVALKYPEGASAPFIAASAKGFLAQKMLEVAAEKKIPITEDAALADFLKKRGKPWRKFSRSSCSSKRRSAARRFAARKIFFSEIRFQKNRRGKIFIEFFADLI